MLNRDNAALGVIAYDEALKARHAEILAELTRQHQPACVQESSLLDPMARSLRRLDELETAHEAFITYQRCRVTAKLEEEARVAFMKHQRQWRKAPAQCQFGFGQTLYGARTVAAIWTRLVGRLESSVPLVGLDEAFEALLALGLTDLIQNQEEEGWWWMGRFLLIHAEPAEALKIWSRRSRSKDPIINKLRADQAMAAVAGPDAARRELLARCAELAAHWAAEVAKLSREHEERVQQSLDCVHADRRVAAGVKSLKAQATLEHKYLAQLEKRLGMLQADRNRPLAFVPKPSDTRPLQKNLPVEKPRLAETIAEPIPQPPLSLQQVMELELGLENRKIHTIDPAHAAQMFHNWPDEELFDNPAYIRFHEVFGHFRNDPQKASLLAILQAVAEDRQERWSYLEAS